MSRRQRPIQGALALFAVGALVFQGCGGVDEVHGASGNGGGQASGGGSGTRAGTNGTPPSAGSSTGGSAGRGGHAGEAGAGHGGATGGDGGIANGGDGGALPFDVDPECHCQLLIDDEFYCTLSAAEFAKRLPVPTDCQNDLNQVTRVTCDDSSTTYRWEAGGEDEYTMQLSASGKPIYGLAFGYVGGLCGIAASAQYDLGSIEAGSYSDSSCFEECSVCEGDPVDGAGGASGAPTACPVCDPRPGADHVTVSLADYCAYMGCPATLADARATIAAECHAGDLSADMTTSCGIVTVRSSTREVGMGYFFSEASGNLIGISVHSDEPNFGPCYATDYDVGTIPTACELESDCSLCGGSLDGTGGAAGGGGTGELPACSTP